jgi:hypothetical protein
MSTWRAVTFVSLLVSACSADGIDGEPPAGLDASHPRAAHPSGLVVDGEGRLDLPADPKWLPSWVVRWAQPRDATGSCIVDGRLLLLGGEQTELRAVDAASGVELWSHAIVQDDAVVACEPLEGSLALLHHYRDVAVIDVRDGRERWRRNVGHDGAFVGGAPARVFLRSCHGKRPEHRCELEALAPGGRTLFRYRGEPAEWPIVASEQLSLLGGREFGMRSFALVDPKDGRVRLRAAGDPPAAWAGEFGLWRQSSRHVRDTLSVRALQADAASWTRRFAWVSGPLHVVDGAVLVIADDAVRLIELASGHDRWSIQLSSSLTAAVRKGYDARVVTLDPPRALLALPQVTPLGLSLILDLQEGTVLQARLGDQLAHGAGDVLLSAAGAVAIDEDAPPARAWESLHDDLEHNLLVLREELEEEPLDPTTRGSWSPIDAEDWLRTLLDAGVTPVAAQLLELLHETYGEAPTERIASQREHALAALGKHLPEQEAAQLSDETLAWTRTLPSPPGLCDEDGFCRMYLLTDAEEATLYATLEAYRVLSESVSDPAPLEALEAGAFGADAIPAGPCGAPRSDAEHAALALARNAAFPLAAVDPSWCKSDVATQPRWYRGSEDFWGWPAPSPSPHTDRDWADAPAIVLPRLRAGCGVGPARVIAKVQGRFRVLEY